MIEREPGGPGSTSPAAPALTQVYVELVASAENLAFLHRYLRATRPGMSPMDVEDVAGRVLTRLIERIRHDGWVPRPEQVMVRAYLRNAADWAVVDTFRHGSRTREQSMPAEALPEIALNDDEVVAALDTATTVEAVRDAMRQVRDSGDASAFRVVTYLLDEIQRTGDRPSNRQIAKACDLSHTAVAKALARVQPLFESARQL